MNTGKPAQPLSIAECRSAAHKAMLSSLLWLSLDLAAMDGGHAENAGAFFGHANEVSSHLRGAGPLKFNGYPTICKMGFNDCVIEFTAIVIGLTTAPLAI